MVLSTLELTDPSNVDEALSKLSLLSSMDFVALLVSCVSLVNPSED